MTHLRKLMVEELQRRNYPQTTVSGYLKTVQDFARYFQRPPDQLGPDEIRTYQLYLLLSQLRSIASSATCLMRSGRLSTPCFGSPSLKPNLVATTTALRKGSTASPASSLIGKRAVRLSRVEESDSAFERRSD